MLRQVAFLDDDPDLRESISGFGAGFDLDIKVFGQYEECRAFLQTEPDAAFVTDLRMPVVDGVQAASEVARDFPRAAKFILTGYDPTPQEKEAFASLRIPIFNKCYDLIDLMERLRPHSTDASQSDASVLEKSHLELLQKHEQARTVIREFADDLLEDLRSMPDPDSTYIVGADVFTVSDLISDISNLTPRGQYFIELWRKVSKEIWRQRPEK